MKSAVFLDRDGVLNVPIVRDNRAYAPLTLKEFQVTDEAVSEVKKLRSSGFLCIVITNQPEIARGLLSPETLEEMHNILKSRVAVDDIFVCHHDSTEGCQCHKPQPGMILAAAKKWDIDLKTSYMIGDRWRDIGAGRTAGCYNILIERPYSQCSSADVSVSNLEEAVQLILKKENHH